MSGAKSASRTKKSVIPTPIQNMARADAARLADRLAARRALGFAADATDGAVSHQYRILGSMNALTKSMIRLTTTTTSAKTTMIPCTAV